MQDTEIVALMAAGDRRGLAAAYDRYADRLHDYARSMLRSADADAAADVTHDTFLIAFDKAGDLRNPERLRSWLYAITRNECLRVLKRSRRTEPLETDFAERSPDMSDDVATADLRQLLHDAANGLSPKDREVFELGMRHNLAAPEIAAALGISDNAAHAMLSRVRVSMERALGAFVVGRDRSCRVLDGLLADWDGTFTPLWRKRIARHIEGCATCAAVQQRELSPAALLAIAPLAAAPVAVRLRLVSADLETARGRADRAGPWRADGFPGEGPRRRRGGGLLAAAAVLLVAAGAASTWLVTGDAEPELEAAQVTSAATSAVPVEAQTVAPTPTLRDRNGTPRASVTRSAAPEPTVVPSRTAAAVPTPRESPTRTPPPAASPRPTRLTSAPEPAPEPAGTLSVTPTELTLRFARGDRTAVGRVQLSADGGSVDWSAAADEASAPYLTLSSSSGALAKDATAVVAITVRNSPSLPRTLRVTFSPGDITVTITVER